MLPALPPLPPAARWAVVPLLVLLGFAEAVATALVHARWPLLVLSIAVIGLTAYALPATWWARLPYTVAWCATTGVLTLPRPEGDFLYGRSGDDYLVVYAVLPLLLVVGVLSSLLPPRRARLRPTPPRRPVLPSDRPGEPTIDR